MHFYIQYFCTVKIVLKLNQFLLIEFILVRFIYYSQNRVFWVVTIIIIRLQFLRINPWLIIITGIEIWKFSFFFLLMLGRYTITSWIFRFYFWKSWNFSLWGYIFICSGKIIIYFITKFPLYYSICVVLFHLLFLDLLYLFYFFLQRLQIHIT